MSEHRAWCKPGPDGFGRHDYYGHQSGPSCERRSGADRREALQRAGQLKTQGTNAAEVAISSAGPSDFDADAPPLSFEDAVAKGKQIEQALASDSLVDALKKVVRITKERLHNDEECVVMTLDILCDVLGITREMVENIGFAEGPLEEMRDRGTYWSHEDDTGRVDPQDVIDAIQSMTQSFAAILHGAGR